MSNSKNNAVLNNYVKEVVRTGIALTNYIDKYIEDNNILEEVCVYCAEEGTDYIVRLTSIRDKIKLARLKDYECYPELVNVDYNLTT
jgi:hypothetical protein